jgi:hypothetical protein
MNGLENRVFEMYRKTINDGHCRGCYERDISEKRMRNPPASFWYLGDNFADETKPRIAFVGKTMWLTRDDLSEFEKNGPIYDVRDRTPLFYTADFVRGYRYWKCIQNVSERVYSIGKEERELVFLENIFITNIAKCDVIKDENDYRDVTDFEYYKNCIDIFEKEIEITKPSHIIFFTNNYFDPLIEKLRFGYRDPDWKDFTTKDCRRQITTRKDVKRGSVCWWHRGFYKDGKPSMHFLRTNHPQGTPKEFDDEIVNWIARAPSTKAKFTKLLCSP